MKKEFVIKLEDLRVKGGKLKLYMAGWPCFMRPVARDSVISAILLNDMKFLHDFLIFASEKQGKKKDNYTGEEPGKIFHETPGVVIRDLSTEFNSCDSTAMFLIGFTEYVKKTKDWNFAKKHEKNIHGAVSYILTHIKKGFFVENPSFCGAKKFSLKNTYWKDSIIIERDFGEPAFPICYALAHIQNMAGLRAAAFLLKDKKLEKKADEMKLKLRKLFDKKVGFIIAKDRKGKINAISSDSLHALFYLEKGDLTKQMVDDIVKASKIIETQIGYRTLEASKAEYIDPYHTRTVWPYEQAVIHAGAKKFELKSVMEVTKRIDAVLDTPHEIFWVGEKGKEFKKRGAYPQLWSIAAKKYFEVTK